jgi:hypothetical protein
VENFFNKLFKLVFRLLLVGAGLALLAGLTVLGFLLFVLGLLRALVLRLLGRPASPWAFKVNRQAVWGRFNAGPVQGRPGQGAASDVIDAEVKEITEVKSIER